MGKVFIIKNNNDNNDIYKFAKESYDKKIERYYNIKMKDNVEDSTNLERNNVILFITYKNAKDRDINDIFIGKLIRFNEQHNIVYKNMIHLESKYHDRVIKSLIDKIDLDLEADFDDGCYVLANEMKTLYEELRERIYVVENKDNECLLSNIENNLYVENNNLHKLAQNDNQAIRLYFNNDIDKRKTNFQNDRESIVSCMSFRRLVDKTQVFTTKKGDYYRTRMTHTLEVNQIAKAIAYALDLNLDLTEAIAVAHDLGHTPFGHQGERTLDRILCGKIDVGIPATQNMFKNRWFGGFKHNYQSAKILTKIEEKSVKYPGLNVCAQVVEGVLKHTKLKSNININDFVSKEYIDKIFIDDPICSSLEGQVVAIADEIAQRGHDVDDALTSGVMTINELKDRLKINKCNDLLHKITKECQLIEKSCLIVDKNKLKISKIVSIIVNYFTQHVIDSSLENLSQNDSELYSQKLPAIRFSDDDEKINKYLEKVVQKKVICNTTVASADYNASVIITKLFSCYYNNPRLLHEGTQRKIFLEMLRHENVGVSNSAVFLGDGDIDLINDEIEIITKQEINEKIIDRYLNDCNENLNENDVIVYEKRRILIRSITDYIAGMTDGYALNEYEKLK
ncbi:MULTISPECIES: deoxyguanosinetriphosphate triphosphohydrolase family protein [Coprobacillaceae]|uniref:deoxyguanosinetriphosphate triphosphohydrolase family protein n=1 Tax=Coprobacillaceae TaxID=2810280 RepID=UPI001314FA15|nr:MULTISPECIES: dNTP triphosphohydrolase [Coprobacillaceae]